MSDARMRNDRPKNRPHPLARATSVVTALAFYLSLGAPYVVRAQDAAPVVSVELTEGNVDEAAADRAAWHEGVERAPLDERSGATETERPLAQRALPSGSAKSAVTPQAISLPKAEGSIEGMGESFTPSLSAGTATFSVPIAVPRGRAGVQPSLELTYSTGAGNGPVGIGWSLAAPYIARQTDKGLPRYVGSADGLWHEEEDTFVYNGGQELVPVDNARATQVDGAPVPAELVSWQQYRARVEGAFMRFFRSPDGMRWVVQDKSGARYDFGVLDIGDGPIEAIDGSTEALQSDPEGGAGRVFSWALTRMSDAHGSSVYYRYASDAGQRYLTDVYYVSPASCAAGSAAAQRACSAPLASYGRRIRLVYEPRDDAFDSYVTTWRITTAQRLRRVEVTAAEADASARTLVRRYHLGYDPASFLSLLSELLVEGRPEVVSSTSGRPVGDRHVAEGALSDVIIGATLPPMRFGYTQPAATTEAAIGFTGISGEVHSSSSSPPHSTDEARTDLFDVNSDGLPDLIVTDPARYRGPDDQPAVGVFFNGFSGPGNSPTSAGEFSTAVPATIPAGYGGVLHLGNANVAPMDVDGDGRSDLLHMPRMREYAYFTPVREPDGMIPAASPSDQGYRFARVPVSLPSGAIDPRIDLGRDARFIKTLDVDNDHLIDVVQTTGTSVLTWRNLGRYPGGDGLFGTATWNGAEWQLSPEPTQSCLLQGGLPVDFESSQVQLADMNGDGLQDIVDLRQGSVTYWPGRGLGSWGDGPLACARGEGEGREIEMLDAPSQLNAELAGVFLYDLNHDGADDIVQIRYDAIDVWWNRAGRGFTSRVTARGTPYAPAFTSTIRFADIDGSGTTDVVFGRAGALQWVDPMGGQRPRLLASVENGLGRLTEIGYGSSAEDYLRDISEADACADSSCERFTWSFMRGECDQKIEAASGECAHRSGGTPVLSTVVRSLSTRDQMSLLGREEHVKRTEYAYHDGYYEGIEQELRGFGAADSIQYGDAGQPTSISRSYFHQGRRSAEIASDRLADNPDEALKGREYRVEVFDQFGTYLSSTFAGYAVREVLRGLNGVAVSYAYVHRNDELRYDTAPFEATPGQLAPDPLSGGALDYVAVRRERAGSSLTEYGPISGAVVERAPLSVRGARYAHIVSSTDDVDNVGNARRLTAHGRVRGELGEPLSGEAIITHITPVRLDAGDAGSWIWRSSESYVTGHGDEGQQLARTLAIFNASGDTLRTTMPITLGGSVPGLEFGGDASGSASYAFAPQATVSSNAYDTWGNPLRACEGGDLGEDGLALADCLRFRELVYDATFAQFPERERTAVAGAPGAFTSLEVEAIWDQGLSAPVAVYDPNRLLTELEHDGLGRLSSLTRPNVRGCEGSSVPNVRYSYEMANAATPVSSVTTETELSCAALGAETIVTKTYVDGLGRTRASVIQAESPSDPASATRVQRSGIGSFHAKGALRASYQSDIVAVSIDALSPHDAVALPGTPSVQSLFDAFDRPAATVAEDLAVARMRYHALSMDAWDPLDLDPSSPHAGTPTTTRSDGHGRIIDSVLRNRVGAGGDVEFHRLFTVYRADGETVSLTRAQTTDDRPRSTAVTIAGRSLARTFFLDSRGRRVGSTDPDADAPAQPASRRGWRYLFNRVDDLVAVRDPRGCGQNFFYDRAGRLIGEDYVRCSEAQVSGETAVDSVPAGSVALDGISASAAVDARYYFDELPSWASSANGFDLPPSGASRTRGRPTASIDRGQRSVLAYDDRGGSIWQARQMAVIPSGDTIPLLLANPPTVDTADSITLRAPVYDQTTYVRETMFDHGGRVRSIVLPRDPDYSGTAPRIGGILDFNARGLPVRTTLTLDDVVHPIVAQIDYTRDGLPERVTYGDSLNGERRATVSTTYYDVRRRPDHQFTVRDATALPNPDPVAGRPLGAVTVVADQRMRWDAADNLVGIDDLRDPTEWRNGSRPASYSVAHDALYRVIGVEYDYTRDDGARVPSDSNVDYRDQLELVEGSDPMRFDPAPRLPAAAAGRVVSLAYEYDWLASMVDWSDDAGQFFERSIGRITNGQSEAGDRPSALRLASDLPTSSHATNTALERGGYVEADYGVGGNLVSLTAHARCRDRDGTACYDAAGSVSSRRAHLRNACVCASEQHYQFRWDEVNRLAEARRYDRAGENNWGFGARQRYRYDAANQRAIKQVMDATLDVDGEVDIEPSAERVALYVYPGELERRGIIRVAGAPNYYAPSSLWGTESQYLVGSARVVVRSESTPVEGTLDRDLRATVALTDVIQSTIGVIDLASGSLVETSTYYPSGARETYRAPDGPGERFASEPNGFTGKETDEEVGVTYFGHRYLVPRLGRWASPDPLALHAMSGGEPGNSYHYVSGNILQARDPLGLCAGADCDANMSTSEGGAVEGQSGHDYSGYYAKPKPAEQAFTPNKAPRKPTLDEQFGPEPKDELILDSDGTVRRASAAFRIRERATIASIEGGLFGGGAYALSIFRGDDRDTAASKASVGGAGDGMAQALAGVATAKMSGPPSMAPTTPAPQWKPPAPRKTNAKPSSRWRVGEDIYKPNKKGDAPSWDTARKRFWKNEATIEGAERIYGGADNVKRMKKGAAPQRHNEDRKGTESLELSHEPIPQREGGEDVTTRWPQEHSDVDPHRHVNY